MNIEYKMLKQSIALSFIIISLFDTIYCEKQTFQFDTFGYCLKQNDRPNIIKCAGQQMLETLETFNSLENFTLTKGLVLSRDENMMGRSNPINFLEQDPNDIRTLLENAGLAVSHRSLQYDMGKLYPGLQLRIGPTVNGGLLEFIVDPSTQYDERSHLLQEESTARIMTKKFVLPFLLGLKFNLATLLPLILGAIILISKKAAFLSKLALFISGLFGIGGIYSLGAGLAGHGGYSHGYGYAPPVYADAVHHQHISSPYKIIETNTPRDEHVVEDHFYDFDKHQLFKDRTSRLHEREFDHDKNIKYRSNQRNFVWQTSTNSK